MRLRIMNVDTNADNVIYFNMPSLSLLSYVLSDMPSEFFKENFSFNFCEYVNVEAYACANI
jgi:hypothetical protein